jgi:hypothetical protein
MRSFIGISVEAGTGLVGFFMIPKESTCLVLIRT